MKVGIICAPGLEECEALIVYDLLYRVGIEVKLIGFDKELTSSHSLVFKTNVLLADFDYENYDCIVLPGGIPGANNLEGNSKVQEIIDYYVKNNKLIAAVCAAPSILNHKGLLKEGKFVCYPGFEGDLKTANTKAIKENNIITAKGLGACFEFSYEIIKALTDETTAQAILNKIQY